MASIVGGANVLGMIDFEWSPEPRAVINLPVVSTLLVAGLVGAAQASLAKLPETLHPEYRRALDARQIWQGVRLAASDRLSIGYTLALTAVADLADDVPGVGLGHRLAVAARRERRAGDRAPVALRR